MFLNSQEGTNFIMNITLTHRFLYTAHSLTELLTGCTKLSTFCSRLEKQAVLYPNRYNPDKYKGDGFELFAEALIKLSPVDSRIGISNYIVIEGQDVGVDGTGIGNNGKTATVQVKYRGHGKLSLTAVKDNLNGFVMASLLHNKVDPNDKHNMLVITTAAGLHHFTDREMFLGQVRCLGYDELRTMVDNNNLFWSAFRALCGVD